MKACVFIAAHCPPKVLKLTLGSWLNTYDGSYEAVVYVGLHKNFSDYHPGLDELKALEPHVRLNWVDEMDWREPMATGGIMAHIMRFSEMHARSLRAMMVRARSEHPDVTHVAFLDHDLIFKMDFVKWAMDSGMDMVGTLFENRDEDREVEMDVGGKSIFAPKVSAWHMVASRLMFDCMLEWPYLVMPGVHAGRVYDTLSRSYAYAKQWGLKTRILPEAEVAEMVVHMWSMSFNYGSKQVKQEEYERKVALYEAEYDHRFPDGIGHLLAKLGGA